LPIENVGKKIKM